MGKKSRSGEKTRNLENQLKRALADYANLQKRVDQEKDQILTFARVVQITKFLKILDVLEMTEREAKGDGKSSVRHGLELAVKEFKKLLEEEGVGEIDTKAGFDPRLHEAIEAVPGSEDNKIVEVLQKGYKINDKILRAAKVRVSKKETR